MTGPGSVWERKPKPTFLGKAGAIAKGMFITGEPLVEYAEYMLRFNVYDRERKLGLYRLVARSEVTDRLYEKVKTANDGDIQVMMAKGFERAFYTAMRDHERGDIQQYSAVAMRGHWKERREYVKHVKEQASDFLKKFWAEPEARDAFVRVVRHCESLADKGWMKEDKWYDGQI